MRALLLAGVVAFGWAGGALANTASGGSLGTSGPADYSVQLGYLAKFNPNAGTLTGVSFIVGYAFSSTITVTATTDSTGNVSTESAAQFNSSDAAIKAVIDSIVNKTTAVIGSSSLNPAAYDLKGDKSIYNVGPSYGHTTAQYASSGNASNTYQVSQTDFSAFVANQNSAVFDVYGQTLTGLNILASGGNASATQQTTANQTFSVLYTYTPASITDVPEPASLTLLGMGVAGMIAARRRRAG